MAERRDDGMDETYPNCQTNVRIVDIGGLEKSELIEKLARNNISKNASAERLFASERFTTSPTRRSVITVELTISDFGFPRGATIAEI